MGVDANEPIVLPAFRRGERDIRAEAYGADVEEVFLRCEHRLGKYLVQMVGDRVLAEDLLQDTFHDAFRARRKFPDLRNPEAWLFAIANRRALASLRRRRRFDSAFRRLTRQHESLAPADQDHREIEDLLDRHLTPEDRALVVLHYLHGFSGPELAEMTGRTPAAVRQRLGRARARLLAAATASSDHQQAL